MSLKSINLTNEFIGFTLPNPVYTEINKRSKVGDLSRRLPFHELLHRGVREGATLFPGGGVLVM